MRSNSLHTKFARYIDPTISARVAKRVNHVMDNPSPTDKAIYRMFNLQTYHGPRQKRARSFGPQKIGHRIYNHEWTDAVIRGYIEGGTEGAKAGIIHNIADMLSDMARDSVGTDLRNLAEAGLEFVLSKKGIR